MLISEEAWASYDAWNAAIEAELFDGSSAGKPVYLDLENDVLERMASYVGAMPGEPVNAFVQAVKATLHLGLGPPCVFSEHVWRARCWSGSQRKSTPPFLATLGVLSVVAEEMRGDSDFRASNYYGRLCQMLGLDPSHRPTKDKVVRCFMQETHILWRALNEWLEEHDGRLGLPTAFAFDYRVYVGVPMSQALVRESDRRILAELFARYRLRPGQVVSRGDMVRLLEDWIPGSSLSAGLKTLCRRREALERVADVAGIELQAWDGRIEESEGRRVLEGDLLVAASLSRHPRPHFECDLLVRSLLPLPAGRYELEPDASPHAVSALEDAGGGLELADASGNGWRGFADSWQVSMPDVLFATLRLRRGEAALRRDPRRLVVLEHDEEYRRYIEVNRVQLGRDNILLALESLADEVEEVLDEVARPGYSKVYPDQFPGLPEGWVAFSEVEIMDMAETRNPDLAVLIPLSWTEVSLGGGFSLPARSTWLSAAPPEARVASLIEEEVALILVREDSANEEEPAAQSLAQLTGSEIISLADLRLPDGDYRLALNPAGSGGATLASSAFRLRSADRPRVLLGDEDDLLGHDLSAGSGWAVVSAAPLFDAPSLTVIGPRLEGTYELPSTGELADPPKALGRVPSDDYADDLGLASGGAAKGGAAPPCLLGGGHYFLLPPAGPERPAWNAQIEAFCKLCGLEKWFPARPRGRWGRGRRGGSGGARRQAAARHVYRPARPAVERIAPKAPADFDMLLEGLCFAQRGNWSSFDALARQVDDSPWFPLEAARVLAALGHLELVLSDRTLRPERWSICEPTMVLLPGGEAVLSGYRSGALLRRLAADVQALGGSLAIEGSVGAPSVVRVTELCTEELAEVCASVRTALERPLETADPYALAALLPDIRSIVGALPTTVEPRGADVLRFDLEQNKWLKVAHTDEPGAYRFTTYPTRYAFRGNRLGGGHLRLADNRLVKWLIGAELGVAMLAYDSTSRSLFCRLGAQLPGLYERAAALCSGEPPIPRKDGTVLYGRVPIEVARLLWRHLGPT